MQQRATPNRMDMSNANYCDGDADPSDCPYNFYRTVRAFCNSGPSHISCCWSRPEFAPLLDQSGDINARWPSMLANLETTLRFLQANASRPGVTTRGLKLWICHTLCSLLPACRIALL